HSTHVHTPYKPPFRSGECAPVHEASLQSLEGGERIRIGEAELEICYTPGHASHHVTYWEPESRTAFVGDTAGIRVEGNRFLLPADRKRTRLNSGHQVS